MTASFNKKLTPKEAKQKIGRFCAYQERCHQEVRDKLYGYGLAPDDVEEIIYELIQQDFLNEERFALAFVRGKFLYKKWGKTKIVRELKFRRISDYCIKKGLKEIDADKYEEVLLSILQKKVDSLKSIKGYQKNYKAAQFAMGKGYESDLIWTLLKSNFDN
ncbi:MAG: regulatory protein RecX [Bacteroidia bacterium]